MAVTQPCIEKIYVNFNAPTAFNLRQKILGDQNANLQYIVNETKANVSLRGRNSGFIETNTGAESNEPMHLYIEHPVVKSLLEAKNLAKNLLETVQQDLQVFMQTNQTNQNLPVQQPPIVQATTSQPVTIPSAILSVPPPNIIQNNAIQPTHIIQSPNFIPQAMQIIQQTPINIPPPTGLNIPNIRGAAGTPISVQFQGQPNIQLQPTGQPILFNQPTQQYQLQYIPANAQQAQTIQHFIQPQQQIQGIIQPNAQQFITLQGNTAFMLPPPNLVHNPQTLGTVFNAPPITINQEDLTKADGVKSKIEESKNLANPQQLATTSRAIINQPPPNIQQFLVNANSWPQNQQLQGMPIHILAQPQQAIAQGQQVLSAFTPQQAGSLQQIQFTNQPIITQPPPTQIQIQNVQSVESPQPAGVSSVATVVRPNQSLSFQQQFEQKMMNEQQRRAVKRKVDEPEEEAGKSFPKAGIGAMMTKTRLPPPAIHQNQPLIKVTSNNRMIANVNTSSSSADNISVINSKNNNMKTIFTKTNTTSSATKSNVTQVDAKTAKPANAKSDDSTDLPTSSSAVSHQNYEIQSQFMQPPPNIQFNQARGVAPQMLMYQTQMPPPTIQQQHQDLSMLQNQNANFVQQLNINRFNVPRGMIVQMNTLNENAANLTGNANFQQQGQPRYRPQW